MLLVLRDDILHSREESTARTSARYITVKADKSIDRLWYGLWRTDPKKKVYVVEGPLDSLFIPNTQLRWLVPVQLSRFIHDSWTVK